MYMTHIKNAQKYTYSAMCINSPLSFHVGQENCTFFTSSLQLTVSVQLHEKPTTTRGKGCSHKENA